MWLKAHNGESMDTGDRGEEDRTRCMLITSISYPCAYPLTPALCALAAQHRLRLCECHKDEQRRVVWSTVTFDSKELRVCRPTYDSKFKPCVIAKWTAGQAEKHASKLRDQLQEVHGHGDQLGPWGALCT